MATPADLQIDTFRPLMRVAIENDTAPANNIVVFREVEIVVTAASQVTTLGEGLGDPPPVGELTEGNLSEWQLEAYRGNLPVNPGVRLGEGAAPVAGRSFVTGVAPWADRLILRYPRSVALKTNWDLSNRRSLEFWLSLSSNTRLRKGHPRIVLRSAHGSRVLTRVKQKDWTSDFFQRLSVPLAGDANWTVTNHATFDSRQVIAFELDFQFDKPGAVVVNLDGVQFTQ